MQTWRTDRWLGWAFNRLQSLGFVVGLGVIFLPGFPLPVLACDFETQATKQAVKPQPLSQKTMPQFVGITRCPSSLNEASQQFQKGDYEAALHLFSALIEQAPQDAVGWINRAAALDYLGQSSDALRDIDQALSLDMSHAYRVRALSLREQIVSELEQP